MAQPQVFPASLPQFPVLGHQEGTPDNLERNQMDTGPPQTRQISTLPKRPVSMNFMMTDAQKITMTAFFRTTLKDGSLEFTHFLPDNPSTLIVFKFRKAPVFNNKSFNLWSIKLDLWFLRLG